MAVTNTIQPPKIGFSKNNIIIELTSDDYAASTGTYAVATIGSFSPIIANKTITIQWSKAKVVMMSSNTPDDSGTSFITGDGGAAHIANIAAYLRANYYIDRDFVVTYTSTTIVLTAREKGTAFNLSIDSTVVSTTYSPGSNFKIKPNFKHLLQVWVKLAGTFTNVFERLLELNYPYTGATTKDLAEILHPYLVPGFANNRESDRPPLTDPAWFSCPRTVLEYYFKFAQSFGDKPEIKALKSSSSAYVNIGSLDIQNAASKTLVSFLRPDPLDDSKTLCLRQGSKVKKIQQDQPEHLYWLNLTETTVTIKVRFELFYVGGGSIVWYSSTQNSAPFTKYVKGVGYVQAEIGFHLPSGKTCSYYTATIVNHLNQALSATYTYEMDVYREHCRYIIFRNSLGAFQTIYTWGKAEVESTLEKLDFNTQITDKEAAASGRNQEINIKLQEKTTVFTGYTTQRDIRLLKDFFASEEKYLVDVSNDRYIPIGLSSDSLKEAQDGSNVHGASFEFYPKYDEVAYTDDPAQADNINSAYVPVLSLVYCGPSLSIPVTQSDVTALTAVPFADSINFATGTSRRVFNIVIQSDKSITSITDLNTVLGADLTAHFTLRSTIAVDGIPYNVFSMVTGIPFPESHNLKFNLS